MASHLLDKHLATSLSWHSIVDEFLKDKPEFKKYGRPATPLSPQFSNPMKCFAYFITYQAFTARSCKSMWDQLVNLVNHLLLSISSDNYNVWPPSVLINIPDEELYGRNGVGLSKNKINAIKGMAHYLIKHPHIYDKHSSSKEIIINISKQIKGVGPFTIASFLIEFGHLDIANYYDRIVRKGIMIHYKLDKVPTIKQAEKLLANKWGKYKTIGTLYMFAIVNKPPRMNELLCHIYTLQQRLT